MRRSAKGTARFYVSRNQDDRALTADDIAQLLDTDRSRLAARVRKQGASLRGTGAYWVQRSKDLAQMVRQIGLPSLFLTLSAADIQWPVLQAFMPRQPSGEEPENIRQRRCGENLNKNPALAAAWFEKRFKVFLHTVLKPLFNITDHWYRFEWQSRGSSHVHALLWCDGVPTADALADMDPNIVSDYVDSWKHRMVAINPGQHFPPSDIHPSAIPHSDLSYTNLELAQLLNRVQQHTHCSDTYCLRKPKGALADTPKTCRFKFPKAHSEIATLELDAKGNKTMIAARNDSLLNEYNPVVESEHRYHCHA
jgi:ATP-dependent DNA helicase PIF1